MGYAPQAIIDFFGTVNDAMPQAINAGIYGDWKPGYHNSRNNQVPPGTDYSVQKSYDQEGDGNAGSAIDVTLYEPADMKRVTQRLIDAVNAGEGDGGRLRALREFFGTVDAASGVVTGMDVPGRYYISSDPSHLWHVHLSGKRKYVNDHAAWQDVAAVFTGGAGSGGSGGDDEMPTRVHVHTNNLTQAIRANTPTALGFNAAPVDPDNLWGDNPDSSKKYVSLRIGGRMLSSTVSVQLEGARAGIVLLTSLQRVNGEGVQTYLHPWHQSEDTGGGYVYAGDSRNTACPKDQLMRVLVQTNYDVNVTRADWDVLYW